MLEGAVAQEIYPTAGILAGSSAATYECKAMVIYAVRRVALKNPEVRFSVHIDDFAQDSVDNTAEGLACKLTNSCIDLYNELEVGLKSHQPFGRQVV